MKKAFLITLTSLAGLGIAFSAQAGSIENMERERAIVISQILDPAMSSQTRWKRMGYSKRRMVDLERIALNDKSLQDSREHSVMRAFRESELSFLVHAATESQRPITVHWLETMGLTTSDLMNARISK